MSGTEEFLNAFNELEQFLRESTGSSRAVPFGSLIARSADHNAATRAWARDLREWGDLRNAIVHEYPKGRIIAAITPEALSEFQGIVAKITDAPRIIPMFQRVVRVFSPLEPLTDVIQYLLAEGFSQGVVRRRGRDGKMTLLTYAGISRYLGTRLENGVIEIGDATVGNALPHEKPGGLAFLPRDALIYAARELFMRFPERKEQRLQAILITENGDATEGPLGIITPSDILEAGI